MKVARITGFALEITFEHSAINALHKPIHWSFHETDLDVVLEYLSQSDEDENLLVCIATRVEYAFGEAVVDAFLIAPVGTEVFPSACMECGWTEWSLECPDLDNLHCCERCRLTQMTYGGIAQTESLA